MSTNYSAAAHYPAIPARMTRARVADFYPAKRGSNSAVSAALFLSIDPEPHWILSWWAPVLLDYEKLYEGTDLEAARDAWFRATGVNLFEQGPVCGNDHWPRWLTGEATDLAAKDPNWVYWDTKEWAARLLPPPPPSKAMQIVEALLCDLGKRGLCIDDASKATWVEIVEKML